MSTVNSKMRLPWLDFIWFSLFVLLLGGMMFYGNELGLGEVILSSTLVKASQALIAVTFVRLTLFIFDKATESNFNKWLANAKSRDLAIYYGFRYAGTALLFGLIIG